MELLTSRTCLFHQVTGCEKHLFDDDCMQQCAKSASITNLKKSSFLVEKTKGNYHQIYNDTHFLNTDIAADIPDLFSGFFMSGLLIPFALMGPLLQMEAFILPTTHFVIISRSIFVKGAGLAQLQGFALALLSIGALFFTLTSLMFKKKL